VVQAFSQKPLNEPPLALAAISYNMEDGLRHLLSSDPEKRAKAAETLKRFGDENTARRIESILFKRDIPPEVRSEARKVLLELSSKYREYLHDSAAKVRRIKAISIPARTKTPPRGIRAIRI